MEIRKLIDSDISVINKLFKNFSGYGVTDKVNSHIKNFPSVALIIEGNIVGFAYCSSFAPDIIELANIFIQEEYRNGNNGSLILKEIEKQAKDQDKEGIILVNSMGYSHSEKKRSAKNFYLKNDYELLKTTEQTLVFYKKIN